MHRKQMYYCLSRVHIATRAAANHLKPVIHYQMFIDQTWKLRELYNDCKKQIWFAYLRMKLFDIQIAVKNIKNWKSKCDASVFASKSISLRPRNYALNFWMQQCKNWFHFRRIVCTRRYRWQSCQYMPKITYFPERVSSVLPSDGGERWNLTK